MIEPNVKVYLSYSDYKSQADLFIYIEEADGSISMCEPLTLTFKRTPKSERGHDYKPEPTITFDTDILKGIVKGFAKLADKEGLPKESEAAANAELRATKTHLDDMRNLVFASLMPIKKAE